MFFVEKQLEKLRRIDYPVTRGDDFNDFWDGNKAKVAAYDSRPKMKSLDNYPIKNLRIYDAVVHGLDGTPVRAWVWIPAWASTKNKAPAAVVFHGGGRSRGNPLSQLGLAAAGFVVIAPDFRCQGGETRSNTPITSCVGKSFATGNIDQDKENYYFNHAFTDQMLMVKFAMSLEEVDASRVAVAGASQGGGTSLIMAALIPEIALCLAAAPSYVCWERRIFTRTACAADIAKYIEAYPERAVRTFRLMSYFDAMNFCDRIACPVEMQCCLKDADVPPECVYAGYNKIKAPKHIRNYPFGEHSDVDYEQWLFDLRRHLHP